MNKKELPVILLKNLVLLPYQEVRVELSNTVTKNTVELSKKEYNDELLVVCPLDSLEENPDTSDLPNIGVIGKVKSNIELPNGNNRIVIFGMKRVSIIKYRNSKLNREILDSEVEDIMDLDISEIEENAYLRKLTSVLEKYIKKNHYISNSILSQIRDITSLDTLTDLISNFLPLKFEKKLILMQEENYIERSKILIKEIRIESSVIELELKIDNELKKELDNSQKEYMLKEKIKVIKKELGEKDTKHADIENIKNQMKKIKLPMYIKKKIESELEKYSFTPELSPEIGSIRSYINYLLNIPWNKHTNDEVNLNKIEEVLNETHYGMEEAKTRIVEYIAVKSMAPNSITPILCLVGPPGVGKTTFGRTIANALNKEYVKISLGGMNDPYELTGHTRTYIGSNPGKIVTSLIKCNSMNPVFLLDEVDKLKKDYKGDPASTLLDILDPTQNHHFIDNYIDEEVDLSKALFILTANDVSEIPAALLDRLEIINISGYTDIEKKYIALDYLLPRALKNIGLEKKKIIFDNSAIEKMIEEYTKESGVRELDRIINRVIRKVITEYKKKGKEIKKVKITKNSLSKYLNRERYRKKPLAKTNAPGFMTALAYTPQGGVTIDIEVTSYPGKGDIKYTGCLSKIINESIEVAISYIKSMNEYFKIDLKVFESNDFHIHFREGAIPKDGPSAGINITTAILSYLKKTGVKSNVSMTGEMTLAGDVLRVGGIKEKTISAIKNDIDTVYLSEDNLYDVEWIEDEIKDKIKIIPVKNYKEIYDSIFK